MRLILKEKIENLGNLGDLINVKPGYGRNYLIPYGKAIQATRENIDVFNQQKDELEKIEVKRFQNARENAKRIEGKRFFVKAAAGDNGKLFGSIKPKEVAKIIEAQENIRVEKRNISIPEGMIRSIGEFTLSVRLHTGVSVEIGIIVEPK